MTIKTTRWEPDTCECAVVYEWDDDVPSEQRIHSLSEIINKGPEHAHILDASLYTTVLDENRRKNVMFNIVNTTDPEIIPEWEFTAGRVLQITFSGNIPNNIKQQLQAAADLQFGSGKVEVL